MSKKIAVFLVLLFLLLGAGAGYILGEYVIWEEKEEGRELKPDATAVEGNPQQTEEKKQGEGKEVSLYFIKLTKNGLDTSSEKKKIDLGKSEKNEIIRQMMEELIRGPQTNAQNAQQATSPGLLPIIPGETKVTSVTFEQKRDDKTGQQFDLYVITLSKEALTCANAIVDKIRSGNSKIKLQDIGKTVSDCIQRTIKGITASGESYKIKIKIQDYDNYKNNYKNYDYWSNIVNEPITIEYSQN